MNSRMQAEKPSSEDCRAAVKQAGRAARLLLAISVALLATLGAISAAVTERHGALRDSGGDRAILAAYSVDRELRNLRHTLSDEAGSTTQGDGAARAYLAVLERIEAMETAGGSLIQEDRQALARKLAGIRIRAESLAPDLTAAAEPGLRAQRLARAAAASHSLTAETEALVTFTIERTQAALARAMDGIDELQHLMLPVVAVLAAATALLLLNLLKQLRRAGRDADPIATSLEERETASEARPLTIQQLHALVASAAKAPATPTEVWDVKRVEDLHSAVGEDGLRDLLRLFKADAPALLSQLARAVAVKDGDGADHALRRIKGAAANLGLASLAALAEGLRHAGIDDTSSERLAAEIARIRALPDIQNIAGRFA